MNTFTYTGNHGSGSGYIGDIGPCGILTILNRWHEYTRHGTTMLTIMFGKFAKNIECVDDSFGNLVALDMYREFHRPTTSDD